MTRTPLAGALAGLVGDVAQEEGPLPRITRRGFLAGRRRDGRRRGHGPAARPRRCADGSSSSVRGSPGWRARTSSSRPAWR